jgi:hypothetical protein
MKLTDILNESVYVKNKETGNVYQVKNANPAKHEPPSKGEVKKAKEDSKEEPSSKKPSMDDIKDNLKNMSADEFVKYGEENILPHLKNKSDIKDYEAAIEALKGGRLKRMMAKSDIKNITGDDRKGRGFNESMKVNEAKYDIGMARKGNGLTVYNKAEEENGDYKNVAHIDSKGKVKYYDKKVPSKIKKQIEAEAKKMMEIKIEGTMKLTDLLNEDVYVKNKKTGNTYKVKNANPSKHEPPSKDDIAKAKSDANDEPNREPKKNGPKIELSKDFDSLYYADDIESDVQNLEGKISDEDYKKIMSQVEDLSMVQQDAEEADNYDSPEEAEEDGLDVRPKEEIEKMASDIKDMIRQANGTPKEEPKSEPKKDEPKSEPKRVPLDKNDSYYIKTAVEKKMGPAAFKALSYGDMQKAYNDEMESRGWEKGDDGEWTKPANESSKRKIKESKGNTMKLKDLLSEDVYVKNKKTGNTYAVKTADPSKHEPPSKGEVEKAKSDANDEPNREPSKEEPKKDEPKKDEPKGEKPNLTHLDYDQAEEDLEELRYAGELSDNPRLLYNIGDMVKLLQSGHATEEDIQRVDAMRDTIDDMNMSNPDAGLEKVDTALAAAIKSTKNENVSMKLKDLLKESFKSGKVYSNPFHTSFVKEDFSKDKNEMTNEEKMAFLEAVKSYRKFGESIYRKDGLAEVYESIRSVVENASKHMVKETEGSFDGITVGRHVKRMNESFKVFEKTLRDVVTLEQRLTSSYDDIGETLQKYYEIADLSTEGNEFGAARAKAIANGDSEFEVDGKKYPVKGVDKDDKENAKEFTNESKSMKLTSMLNESFGYGELPSSKLMKMKVSAKEMMNSVKNKKVNESEVVEEEKINEGFSTWEMRFSDMNLGGVKLSKKNVYKVKARNTVEAIKKAAKMAGVEKNWIATETHSLKKIG